MDKKQKTALILSSIAILAALGTYLVKGGSPKNKEEAPAPSVAPVEVADSGPSSINTNFLEGFYQYNTLPQRNSNVQGLMTDQGYKAINPSYDGEPVKVIEVHSSIVHVDTYPLQLAQAKWGYYNEVQMRTVYKGKTFNETETIKTVLVKNAVGNWLVDDVEILSGL